MISTFFLCGSIYYKQTLQFIEISSKLLFFLLFNENKVWRQCSKITDNHLLNSLLVVLIFSTYFSTNLLGTDNFSLCVFWYSETALCLATCLVTLNPSQTVLFFHPPSLIVSLNFKSMRPCSSSVLYCPPWCDLNHLNLTRHIGPFLFHPTHTSGTLCMRQVCKCGSWVRISYSFLLLRFYNN